MASEARSGQLFPPCTGGPTSCNDIAATPNKVEPHTHQGPARRQCKRALRHVPTPFPIVAQRGVAMPMDLLSGIVLPKKLLIERLQERMPGAIEELPEALRTR